MGGMKMRIPVYIFFILFVLSGFSGLIYESIWSHYLKLFLGHAAYAQTLVLAMFMGGMAIGSAISAKFSYRWKNLLLGYAAVEGVIGICALLFHQLFTGTTELAFASLIPSFNGSLFMIETTKWGLASLLILPQSILLGMTFPLMVAGILRKYPDAGGKTISTLYFTNSIGGVFGVLVSSFVLIYHMGLPGTIMVAGFINIILALIVWLLAAGDTLPSIEAETAPNESKYNIKLISMPALLLAVALFTGLSSFMYEMGWIRMLSLVLGSSTHSFELMLAAFILGIALGGWWLRNRIDNIKSPIQFLAYIQILMGIFAVFSLLVYHYSFDAMQVFLNTVQHKDSAYYLYLIFSGLVCLVMMLPATFCAGMTLPLITKMAIKSEVGERGIGFIYASNTLGAIIGIFLSIHFVMPFFGLKTLITAGAVIDILLGLFLLVIFVKQHTELTKRVTLTASVVMTAILVATSLFDFDKQRLYSGVFRSGALLHDTELKFYQDGKTSTVAVYKLNNQLTLSNNGKPDASIVMGEEGIYTQDESTQTLLGIIPLLHKPDAETAAIIGMGSGLSSHSVLASKRLKQVDTIEIEAAVVEASNNFRPKVERAYSDPRSSIHIDDAKTFFTARSSSYDIIVSEPPNPWVSGVSSLFTQEFYQRVKNHMNPDAVFVQWLHLYEIDINLIATVFNALGKEFTDYKVYVSNNTADIIIVTKKEGMVGTAIFPDEKEIEILEMLSRYGINNNNDLQLHVVTNKEILNRALHQLSSEINSDYFPVLENGASRSRFAGESALELYNILDYPVPVLKLLKPDVDTDIETYTKTDSFPLSRNIYNAYALKKLLLEEAFNDENIDGRAEQRYSFITVLKHQLAHCSNGQPIFMVRSLYKLSAGILPYLSQNELKLVWNKIGSSACFENAPNDVNQWFSLYQSISSRDSHSMVQLSELLLSSNPGLDKDLSEFLVISALLGNHLSRQGNGQRIYDKWKEVFRERSAETQLILSILSGG